MRKIPRRIIFLSVFLMVPLICAGLWLHYQSTLAPKPHKMISEFSFDKQEALKSWTEKVFKGKTNYDISQDEQGRGYLVAKSIGTSSALYMEVDVDLDLFPQLVWEWKAVTFPVKKKHQDLGDGSENDFAARVYAVFRGGTVFTTHVIQYVWDERFPVGETAHSVFSKNVKVLVVESGPPKDGQEWVTERRDIVKDYLMLYGKPPNKDLGAIALMTDSDNTRTESEANFRYLSIELQAKNTGDSG